MTRSLVQLVLLNPIHNPSPTFHSAALPRSASHRFPSEHYQLSLFLHFEISLISHEIAHESTILRPISEIVVSPVDTELLGDRDWNHG